MIYPGNHAFNWPFYNTNRVIADPRLLGAIPRPYQVAYIDIYPQNYPEHIHNGLDSGG